VSDEDFLKESRAKRPSSYPQHPDCYKIATPAAPTRIRTASGDNSAVIRLLPPLAVPLLLKPRVRAVIERAVSRGQLPTEIKPSTLISALVGPLYYRRWYSREPNDDQFVRTIVGNVLGSRPATRAASA
jgi:hypothetical protein